MTSVSSYLPAIFRQYGRDSVRSATLSSVFRMHVPFSMTTPVSLVLLYFRKLNRKTLQHGPAVVFQVRL